MMFAVLRDDSVFSRIIAYYHVQIDRPIYFYELMSTPCRPLIVDSTRLSNGVSSLRPSNPPQGYHEPPAGLTAMQLETLANAGGRHVDWCSSGANSKSAESYWLFFFVCVQF